MSIVLMTHFINLKLYDEDFFLSLTIFPIDFMTNGVYEKILSRGQPAMFIHTKYI